MFVVTSKTGELKSSSLEEQNSLNTVCALDL